MGLLSRISYLKIKFLATRIEVRNTFYALELCSDKYVEERDKEDFVHILELMRNLNVKDKKKIDKYVEKHRN